MEEFVFSALGEAVLIVERPPGERTQIPGPTVFAISSKACGDKVAIICPFV
jgi:hypothetical protein